MATSNRVPSFDRVEISSRARELEGFKRDLAALPEEQLREIRGHYRLVKHIPGPYLDGVYVYRPAGGALP